MKHVKKLIALCSLGLVLTACGGGGNTAKTAADEGEKTVRLGVVGEDNRVWDATAKKLKEKGIDLEIVTFTDYNQPNDALAAGDLDLNAFQHRIFLQNYNEDKGTHLVPIANTQLAPLGIFSQKVKDVKDLPDGSKIAIPDDVTNKARALRLLESAGLITLEAKDDIKISEKDVKDNPKHLDIVAMDASQTARSLPDVGASVINGGMAIDAGLHPKKDAIFRETLDEHSEPYFNIIVAREEDKDNPLYQEVVKAYHTDENKKLLEDLYQGSYIPLW